MPRTEVVFYQEKEEDAPVIAWLTELRRSDRQAYARCLAAIERLAEFGHELRRPLTDILTDGIHELRVKQGRVNYRILYFFHGRNLAILGHALTKENKVPKADIEQPRRKTHSMAKTKDALKILERVSGNNETIKAGIARAKINFEVAQMIYDARTSAGLSQSDLAALIGSKQPVIARLEDAGYEGHSLTMLQRIATALKQRLELRFVPSRKRRIPRTRVLASSKRKMQPA